MAISYTELLAQQSNFTSNRVDILDDLISRDLAQNFDISIPYKFDIIHKKLDCSPVILSEILQTVIQRYRQKGWFVHGVTKNDDISGYGTTTTLHIASGEEFEMGTHTSPELLMKQIEAMLNPWQRIVYKAIYSGVGDLSGSNKLNPIEFTAEDYKCVLKYANQLTPSTIENLNRHIGTKPSEVILTEGRRSGKSLSATAFALQEVAELLGQPSPQSCFALLPSDEINIMIISRSEASASSAIFDKMCSHMAEMNISAKVNRGQKTIRFKTANSKSGDIVLRMAHMNSNSFIGRSIKCAILDDLEEGFETVYDHMRPAVASYGKAGRIICVGQEYGDGVWSAFVRKHSSDSVLSLQLPTAIMNPFVEAQFLEKERQRDPERFKYTFGAELID